MLRSFIGTHLLVLVRHGVYVGSGGRNLKFAATEMRVLPAGSL
jgi:hypothetical protein